MRNQKGNVSRLSAPNINGFVWRIAQGDLRDAYVRDAGRSRNRIRRRVIHDEPLLRPQQETRTDRLVVDQETDRHQVEIVGGPM